MKNPWLRNLAIIGVGFLILAAWRFKPIIVSGDSMQPSLASGDFLLVDRFAYRNSPPERGDMVIARTGRELMVKRVVGVPNDQICVENGVVLIRGKTYPEENIQSGAISIGTGLLGTDRFAILGDNRSMPRQQVVHAIVPKERIVGKVRLRISARGSVVTLYS